VINNILQIIDKLGTLYKEGTITQKGFYILKYFMIKSNLCYWRRNEW